ncbi:TPA: hypothetical protein N5N39_004698 [Enterobacter cloacae subsp. cloacae]|nr:hypothetical protein [Enterobacter cloacae subsp. cloacae]HCM9444242.1 hypothetical protein [Enterobacter cloacae subsp. cloacae]
MSQNKIEKSLYPSTVFHFTEEYSTLIKILSDRCFKASYAAEKIIGIESERNFGIPMVSFCDIRLSQLNEHTSKYGHFGIGLKKDWALECGMNPVNYLNQNCSMFSYFNARMQQMSKELKKIRTENGYNSSIYIRNRRKYRDLINVLRYMKNYEAPLYRKGVLVDKNYRFANENEWRYVPDIRTDIIPIKIIKKSENLNWKDLANERLWQHKESNLLFDYNDIKYIFVPDDQAAIDLIKHFSTGNNGHYGPLLTSKIFISKQVFDDL